MYPNLKPTQREAILGVIDPQSATTAKSTGWVDASKFQNLLGSVFVGAVGSSGTVDAKLQQATDSSGTSAKDITGKAIVQITASGAQAEINLKQDELDVNNGFTYVKLVITPATAASLIAGALRGVDPRYGPADGYAATTVATPIA